MGKRKFNSDWDEFNFDYILKDSIFEDDLEKNEKDREEEPLIIDPMGRDVDFRKKKKSLFFKSEPKIKYHEFFKKLGDRCPKLELSDSYREIQEQSRKTVKLITNFLDKVEKYGMRLKEYEDELLRLFERAIDLSRDEDGGRGRCDFVKEVSTHEPYVILGLPPRKHPLEKLFEGEDRVKQLEPPRDCRRVKSVGG